jgi:hypothetical protein
MRKQNKKAGFVVTSELLLITTILVIGLIAGWVTVRNSLNAELEDFAEAIGDLNQSYDFAGILNDNGSAETAGSAFEDAPDITNGQDATDGNVSGGPGDWTFTTVTSGEAGTLGVVP